jgi:hypothetical protein
MAELALQVLSWAFIAWSAAAVLASICLAWWIVFRLVEEAIDRVFGLALFWDVGREMWHQGRVRPWVRRFILKRSDRG